MPRGKKRTALEIIDEQLAKVESDLENAQAKVKELQTKKSKLQGQKEKQELSELNARIKASGKSVDQVLQALEA
jgi:phage shock protein A